MRNEVFVYLEICSVYLKIYEYGKVVQGVRFPDDVRFVVFKLAQWLEHCAVLSGLRLPVLIQKACFCPSGKSARSLFY